MVWAKSNDVRIARDGAQPHFVSYEFPTGEAIFSLEEFQSILSNGQALAGTWIAAGAGEYAVASGTYLAQKGVSPERARVDALKCRGLGLGYLIGGRRVETLELVDLELYGADRKAHGLPFAALVRVDGEAISVLRSQSAVLAAFLRYRNLDPATNIANRPGVFAMRELGAPLEPDECVGGAWRRKIDRTQVVRAARGVLC